MKKNIVYLFILLFSLCENNSHKSRRGPILQNNKNLVGVFCCCCLFFIIIIEDMAP